MSAGRPFIVAIDGPAGTGKSLLFQILASHFRGRFQVAHLAGARLGTRRALLQNILFELKLPYRDLDEGELRLSLVDHLEPRSGGTDGLLLLVDEAHTLPLRLLEEIRLLTNAESSTGRSVAVVLVGQPELGRRLDETRLRQLKQRIALRCELSPLDLNETAAYVAARVRVAGGRPDVLFTRDAILTIFEHSLGIPRTISVLCDNALVNGFASDVRPVGRQIVEEVCKDFHLTKPSIAATPHIPAPAAPPVEQEAASAPLFNAVARRRRFSFF